MKWQILSKKNKDIIGTLLKNRDIKNSKDFFDPIDPYSIKLKTLGVSELAISKAIKRIKQAKDKKEQVIIYGDYDADGICATAILWEALHKYGLNVLPHIPDRFEEGYGINTTSVENLKIQIPNLKLIITVDNGIVAYEGIKKADKLGIDVIVIDHHQKEKLLPSAYCLIHTVEVCGSALAWFFAKELMANGYWLSTGLDLAAIGTVADQMPLVGVNRSIVRYGLQELNKTNRVGLKTLFADSKIESIGTYEINYMIAPRINAMGRLAHGVDSLRLLCTKRQDKAGELSKLLSKTNFDRQRIVTDVVLHTKENVTNEKVIVIAHESYHEGVIGLAAGKLVEEFYRPSIVISKGKEKSKASARSVYGFNIIEAIKATGLILEGGGHPMAAGFSIETVKIEEFTKKINKYADEMLTDELLEKKMKIDCEIDFDQINLDLIEKLKQFEPTGNGNYPPVFATKNVEIIESRLVGNDGKHLKLKFKKNSIIFDAIFFNAPVITDKPPITDIAFSIEENVWNNHKNLQLKIKDIKL